MLFDSAYVLYPNWTQHKRVSATKLWSDTPSLVIPAAHTESASVDEEQMIHEVEMICFTQIRCLLAGGDHLAWFHDFGLPNVTHDHC